MRDEDTSAGENMRRDEQGIQQEKPSHMNQGNQTFRPDLQKNKIPSDRRENQESFLKTPQREGPA
jgi:hypothetical protein